LNGSETKLKVTVAVFTFNRVESLRQTLSTLASVRVPESVEPEFLVIDNGSTDGTRELVQATTIGRAPLSYICESRRGVAHSRNKAIAVANGEVLLFIDDDIRPLPIWMDRICAPLIAGKADAIAGGVLIPPHLQRSWMTPRHRAWLGSTEMLTDDLAIISANMGFSRRILAKVPAFDTELGPGALGFWEDSLFSFQLIRAGYKIATAFDALVEHHFHESRLLRSSFLDRARKEGRCRGYVAYHWEHRQLPSARRDATALTLRLLQRRVARRRECGQVEGIPEWEMNVVENIHYYKQYLLETKRERAYTNYGLIKMARAPQST
jgi:glycosyltransferase involved in cell wall biosynthesis